jgi:eukaryotic-like serine/threonine-protein kinase
MRASDLPEPLGTVLDGKYRLESVLGGGGMGIVVAAHHEQLGRRVALKFLLPSYAVREEAAVRFAREARAAARIQSEHVVRVLDVCETRGGVPYMVMEYLEGEDLAALVERVGPLPIHDAVDYLLQACEALAEAHAAGIVHRDLKPANLFLARRVDGSSIVKVCDFGIAKATLDVANLTQTHAFVGSPVYSAPEQLLSAGAVDVRADVWALGVILYEFLTGAMPFTAQTIPELASRILGEAAPDVRLLRADVPAPLAVTIHQCLEKDLERRIPNVGVFAQKLEECAPATSRISVDRIERVLGLTSSRSPGALPSRAPGGAQRDSSGSASSPPALAQSAHVVVRPSGATLPTAALETGRAQAISVATPEQPKKKRSTVAKVSLLGAALAVLAVGAFALRHGARLGPESAASAPTLAAGAAAMPYSSGLELVRPLPEPAVAPLPPTSAAGALSAAADAPAAPSSSAPPSVPAAPAKRARSRPPNADAAVAAERPPATKPPPKPQPNPLEMPLK